MQFFHPLIRTIQKASYLGIVHKEDKLLGGAIASWLWEENWEGAVHGRVLPSCDLHSSLWKAAHGLMLRERASGPLIGLNLENNKLGRWRGKERKVVKSQSNLEFLFKFFYDYICKETDENNLIHSTNLYLRCTVCKETCYAMQEDHKAKKQKTIPSLSLS